jgi:mannose-6-phosphate isomerase-like protein (cupin superfamily)
MRLDIKQFKSKLPLPATSKWPLGVWDIEAFKHGTMSVILYTPTATDFQTNHDQDELYFVMSGSGKILIETNTFAFQTGDALFVPAGKIHRFVEFSEDLVTWAVFWGPVGGEAIG